MRYSHQREIIFEYLQNSTEHPSAEMIHAALHEDNPGLSLGTVYRNLNLLESLGKICRVYDTENTQRYDICTDDHAHFICASCGKVIDLENIDINYLKSTLDIGHGAKPEHLNLTISGLCAECTKVEE